MKNKFRRIIPIAAAAALFTGSLPRYDAEASIIYDDSVVTFNIDTEKGRTPVSPYIYGIADTVRLSGLTVNAVKQSNVSVSTYNWETNNANTGADLYNSNDNSLVSRYPNGMWAEPGLYSYALVSDANSCGIAGRFVTLPMLGYAAGDGNGMVMEPRSKAPERWVSVIPGKNDVLTTIPDINDNLTYTDEYVHYLVTRYGTADSGGITGYFLDREPEYWHENFPMLELSPVSAASLTEKSIILSQAVKAVDDSAMVFGPSLRGLTSYISLNDAPDWNKVGSGYNWFIDYYLAEMRTAEKASGERLLDCLDLHYYTESVSPTGDKVIDCTDYSHEQCNRTRMQTVRTLWDPDYTELSNVHSFKQYTPLIPILQASIQLYYPGTKLSFSEYDFGGGDHISGGIAQADALGCFAEQGVYLACLRPLSEECSYQRSAIELYTNYDGKGSSFGDTIVKADNGSDINSSVFASINGSDPTRLTVVASNKNYTLDKEITFNISSEAEYDSVTVYGMNSESSEIKKIGTVKNISGNSFEYEMPPLSVYIFEINGEIPEGSVTTADDNIGETVISADNDETSVTQPSETDRTEGTVTETAVADGTAVSLTETVIETEPPSESSGKYGEMSSAPDIPVETDEHSDGTTDETEHQPDEGTASDEEKHFPMAGKIFISLLTASAAALMVYAVIIDNKQ